MKVIYVYLPHRFKMSNIKIKYRIILSVLSVMIHRKRKKMKQGWIILSVPCYYDPADDVGPEVTSVLLWVKTVLWLNQRLQGCRTSESEAEFVRASHERWNPSED
eukprot:TCONS_00034847-protein